jgi:hypothetical protein
VHRVRPDAILVGEVLGSSEMIRRHAWGLDGLLDEKFTNDVRAQLAQPKPDLIAGWQQLENAARDLNRAAHDPASPIADHRFHMFPFVGSHDRSPRLASELEELARPAPGRRRGSLPGSIGVTTVCRAKSRMCRAACCSYSES